MSAAPKKSRVTPKQRAADKANLVKARAAQKQSGALHHHTARQKAASRANLVKARAAQKSRRAGKTPVSSKAAQAPSGDSGLHSLPVCAAVAVAASLTAFSGIAVPDGVILDLHSRVQGLSLADLLEEVTEHGLAGWRLTGFDPATPGWFFPGLVCGIRLSPGYHAVLTTGGGMLSWGTVLPLQGTPEEAWILDWEEPGERAA